MDPNKELHELLTSGLGDQKKAKPEDVGNIPPEVPSTRVAMISEGFKEALRDKLKKSGSDIQDRF